MGVLYLSGFETGDTREWANPSTSVAASAAATISGAWCYAIDALVANNQVSNTASGFFSVTEAWSRCRFRFTSTGSPSTQRYVEVMNLQTIEPIHETGVI